MPNIGDDSKDYDDYEGHEGANAVENDADKETRSFPTPKFISESSHILVNEGDTVRVTSGTVLSESGEYSTGSSNSDNEPPLPGKITNPPSVN